MENKNNKNEQEQSSKNNQKDKNSNNKTSKINFPEAGSSNDLNPDPERKKQVGDDSEGTERKIPRMKSL